MAILFAAGFGLSHAEENTPRREKEFKGVQLLARFEKDRNQWRFGMLPGTNREKSAEEVNESMTLVGLDSLLAEMKQLAPQESVSLVSPGWGGIEGDVALTPLDEETQKALITFCAKHEIVLTGEGTWLEMPNRTIGAMAASATRRELILSDTILDGKGLAMIAEKFPALETLILSYSGITDDDLAPLARAKHAERARDEPRRVVVERRFRGEREAAAEADVILQLFARLLCGGAERAVSQCLG